MSSPTQRSLALLKKEGYKPWIVESYNSFGRNRVDLYSFLDIVALRGGDSGILGVQTTSISNISARVHKITGIPVSHLWLETGNRIWIIGWGKIKNKWKYKIVQLKLDKNRDFITEIKNLEDE